MEKAVELEIYKSIQELNEKLESCLSKCNTDAERSNVLLESIYGAITIRNIIELNKK